MKVICETKTVIDEETSCRKEYCCLKLKKAMEEYTDKKNPYGISSTFTVANNKITLRTHESCDNSHDMQIFYCLFCGKKLVIENIKIDNTKDLPVKIVEKIVYRKKKHWWNQE